MWTSISAAQNKPFIQSLEKCREYVNNKARLACYDQIKSDDTELIAQKQNVENRAGNMPVLIADLEEPRIFTSFGSLDFRGENLNAILLGLGTRVKMKTFDFSKNNQDVDFNVIGMIKSQFDVEDIDTRNNRGGALINTDFMVGGELVKAYDTGSLRLKYYHRSTHLGDEFLIDNPEFLDNRLNLSYEAFDLLYYRNLNRWGAYLGGSVIVRSEPGSLESFQAQIGAQYRGEKSNWYTPVFGLDVKSWEASDWHANVSIKAGIEISGFFDRPLQLLFEYYDGKSPYGQFFKEDLSFIGFSVNHYWQ
jgi:hypothetical protein